MMDHPSPELPPAAGPGYSRTRTIATLLLVLMAALFAGASWGMGRWPWLSYVQAFAEAAMIGAIADWFAVTALFRHPLGLPIPHTALVPRNQARIAQGLGVFIRDNFLAPQVVAARLDQWDAATHLTRWLNNSHIQSLAARRLAPAMSMILARMLTGSGGQVLAGLATQALSALPAGPVAGRGLTVLLDHNLHHLLLDRMVVLARAALQDHGDALLQQVARQSGKWVPHWVDAKLAGIVANGVMTLLDQLHDPLHPWRAAMDEWLTDLAHRLDHDPATRQRADTIKQAILHDPAARQIMDAACRALARRLVLDEGQMEALIRDSMRSLARRLEQDGTWRSRVNGGLRRGAEAILIPNRARIGAVVEDMVTRWDSRTLVSKLERHVGDDLHYIRISGTVVGGLTGLTIHTVMAFL